MIYRLPATDILLIMSPTHEIVEKEEKAAKRVYSKEMKTASDIVKHSCKGREKLYAHHRYYYIIR